MEMLGLLSLLLGGGYLGYSLMDKFTMSADQKAALEFAQRQQNEERIGKAMALRAGLRQQAYDRSESRAMRRENMAREQGYLAADSEQQKLALLATLMGQQDAAPQGALSRSSQDRAVYEDLNRLASRARPNPYQSLGL